MSTNQLQKDATGFVMAILVGALIAATIGIWWQARIIAKQQVVIHMLEDGGR